MAPFLRCQVALGNAGVPEAVLCPEPYAVACVMRDGPGRSAASKTGTFPSATWERGGEGGTRRNEAGGTPAIRNAGVPPPLVPYSLPLAWFELLRKNPGRWRTAARKSTDTDSRDDPDSGRGPHWQLAACPGLKGIQKAGISPLTDPAGFMEHSRTQCIQRLIFRRRPSSGTGQKS
jgi:hypothetical protein